VPRFGDRAATLGFARAVLSGDEAEVGFKLMRVLKALGIVDRRDESRRGDGADTGDRAQARHARILDGEVLDRRVRVRELLVEMAHDSEQRRDDREQPARQGQGPDALDEPLGTTGRHAVAVLAEQGPGPRYDAG